MVNATAAVCHGAESQLMKVCLMSDSGREQLVQDVTQAGEVALTLMYADGSSQLRELPEVKVSNIIIKSIMSGYRQPCVKFETFENLSDCWKPGSFLTVQFSSHRKRSQAQASQR